MHVRNPVQKEQTELQFVDDMKYPLTHDIPPL